MKNVPFKPGVRTGKETQTETREREIKKKPERERERGNVKELRNRQSKRKYGSSFSCIHYVRRFDVKARNS